MRILSPLSFASLYLVAMGTAQAAFQSNFVQIPISGDAIIDRPELANAQTWQLQITADNDLWSLEVYVRARNATIFYHPLGSGGGAVGPPEPALVTLFPSLKYDSYLDLPGTNAMTSYVPGSTTQYRAAYQGTLGNGSAANHSWVSDAVVDPPPVNYVAAQMTFLQPQPTFEQQWLVRAVERVPAGGVIDHIITSQNITSPLIGEMSLNFAVNATDLAIWKQQFGQVGVPPINFALPDVVDFDNDGDTDDFDGAILLRNFGSTNASPFQGDVDGDGDVDANDRNKFYQLHWGHKWNFADVDQDLDVDGRDFLQWQRRLGGGFTIPDFVPFQSVPEPSSALIAILPLAALLCRRRRRA